ncbi:MAG: hypothetical protein FJZ16_00640 [Candidatus Omnitrophica bacterium]|nr:hypothetical protein [Candidatus Omnitrophota bacterium]
MELKVKMRLNSLTEIEATFEGADFRDAVRSAGVLLGFDGKCGLCSHDNIGLETRMTKEKGFKYTQFVCRKCGARRRFGEYKDGTGFFLKEWEKRYEGSNGD